MTRPLVPSILAALIALAGAVPACAGLDVFAAATPPEGPQVLLSSPAPAEPHAYEMTHGTGITVGVGQTFRFDHPVELDRITLLLRALTLQVPGELVTLELLTFDDPADVSPDQVLYSGTASLPTSLALGQATYLVFDLDDVALESGRQYGFVLDFSGGGCVSDARAEVLNTAADSYAGGRPFLREPGMGGEVYTPMASDLVFYLEGTGEATPVECEAGPDEEVLVTPEYPGFRFWVRFGDPAASTWWGDEELLCLPEALCVSGAMAGRTEVLIRIVGPKPNGYLWPTLVKLSTSRVEARIEQTATGLIRCYVLESAVRGSDELDGLFDRTGFMP